MLNVHEYFDILIKKIKLLTDSKKRGDSQFVYILSHKKNCNYNL